MLKIRKRKLVRAMTRKADSDPITSALVRVFFASAPGSQIAALDLLQRCPSAAEKG
jgi:hypothetical protein